MLSFLLYDMYSNVIKLIINKLNTREIYLLFIQYFKSVTHLAVISRYSTLRPSMQTYLYIYTNTIVI